MPPPKKKKPLRTPDGRPEFRNPDQILRDAASEISADLPSRSRKLDLDAYFRSGEEHRVSTRLLRDNGVLPQHLQDRKDAEDARTAAERSLEAQIEKLKELATEMNRLLMQLSGSHAAAGVLDAPEDADGETPAQAPDSSVSEALLDELVARLAQFDRCQMDALAHYRDQLTAANEATDRYSKHVAATGRLLPIYPTDARIDVEKRLSHAQTRMPPRPAVRIEDVTTIRSAIRSSRSMKNRLLTLLGMGTHRLIESSKP
jgi:hypothetical protein